MCMGRAQPVQLQQNQPQGISLALKHARNFTQAFGFLFLPRALPWCRFHEASQGQLLGLLTSHRGCFPAPFHENHLSPAAEPGMSA